MRQGRTPRPQCLAGLASTGRYGEISATHLSTATTALLDRWASAQVHEAPLFVAVNVRGWFVATGALQYQAPDLPADLAAALALGRCHGLAFLFFHCDAPTAPGLPIYDW